MPSTVETDRSADVEVGADGHATVVLRGHLESHSATSPETSVAPADGTNWPSAEDPVPRARGPAGRPAVHWQRAAAQAGMERRADSEGGQAKLPRFGSGRLRGTARRTLLPDRLP